MVTPAAGPVIVSSPPASLSSSWPAVRVIVCGAAKTVGSKVIVAAPSMTLARLTAWRRLRIARRRAGPVAGRVDDQGIGLEGADVGPGRVEREAALVGGEAGDGRARPMAGLPGSRAMVWVGPP